MNANLVIVLSFGFFLALFTVIGVLSAGVKKDTTEDYLVAGRDVPPWLTALSAVATNNSGYMFIGLIGFTFREGLSAVWLSAGWLFGDWLVWIFVYERVRRSSEELGVASVPTLLAHRGDHIDRVVAGAAGVLTFLFLGGYAAAQLKAGSAALHSLFGWDPAMGAWLGAGVVLLYCYSGGLRASIWTDAAQSMVMLGAMLILVAAAMLEVGGPLALCDRLAALDPALVRWYPTEMRAGLLPYVLGFVAGGFGAVGAPHILVRAMALESPEAIPRTRNIYYAWFLPFLAASTIVGLYGRVLLPKLVAVPPKLLGADPDVVRLFLVQASESALPEMAMLLLPNVLIGVMLAGIFSATMSTADSQLLSCSAALTQDIFPRWKDSYIATKVGTVSVTALALWIALHANQGVFALVLYSWSLLGASLGPLILLRLYGHQPPRLVAISMMVLGMTVVGAWDWTGYQNDVFRLLPGFLAPMALYGVLGLVHGFPLARPEDDLP